MERSETLGLHESRRWRRSGVWMSVPTSSTRVRHLFRNTKLRFLF